MALFCDISNYKIKMSECLRTHGPQIIRVPNKPNLYLNIHTKYSVSHNDTYLVNFHSCSTHTSQLIFGIPEQQPTAQVKDILGARSSDRHIVVVVAAWHTWLKSINNEVVNLNRRSSSPARKER